MLITGAEVDGRSQVDVRLVGDRIESIGTGLSAGPGELCIDAAGGALLPGLHDHHVHVLAWDAGRHSVRCGPADVEDGPALGRALAAAERRGSWVRGVGYHPSVAGDLDRHALDRWIADAPVRIQHRSGSLWIVNTEGLARLGLDTANRVAAAPEGVERDEAGRATGRFFHLDGWLRDRWSVTSQPNWSAIADHWARCGVIGATDATPHNGPREWALFGAALASGALPQRIVLMGGADLPAPASTTALDRPARRLERGPTKIRLEDPRLPDFDDLCRWIRESHDDSRPVAIHCVTRTELVLATAALSEAGGVPGDRIEHAGVAPPEMIDAVRALPLTVVTQPHFVRERGDAYSVDVDARDRPWLYRCRTWLESGVPLGGGTDAPFGDPDPWAAMAAAIDRRTRSGNVMGGEEALDPESALALFTGPSQAPGAAPRRIVAGASADLCLLDRPWARVREHLDADHVRATICAGRLIHDRSETSESPGTAETPRSDRSAPSCRAFG